MKKLYETLQKKGKFTSIWQELTEAGWELVYYNESYMISFWRRKKVAEIKKIGYVGGQESDEIEKEVHNFIKIWNDKFKEKRKVTPDLIKEYKIKRRKYHKLDIIQGFTEYINAKQDEEKRYRLTPITFIKQSNGIIKYL